MEQQKIAYGLDDIRERYGVGIGKARNIMKSIRAYNKELPMGVTSVPEHWVMERCYILSFTHGSRVFCKKRRFPLNENMQYMQKRDRRR